MQNEAPLAPIGPEEITVLVDDEKLCGDFCREPPFPFGHDRLGRADDSDGGVVARLQFAEQLRAAFGLGVIGHARYGSSKTNGRAGEARDQIDHGLLAEDLIKFGNQRVEEMARAALDQEDASEGRDVAAEEVAQVTIVAELK